MVKKREPFRGTETAGGLGGNGPLCLGSERALVASGEGSMVEMLGECRSLEFWQRWVHSILCALGAAHNIKLEAIAKWFLEEYM